MKWPTFLHFDRHFASFAPNCVRESRTAGNVHEPQQIVNCKKLHKYHHLLATMHKFYRCARVNFVPLGQSTGNKAKKKPPAANAAGGSVSVMRLWRQSP